MTENRETSKVEEKGKVTGKENLAVLILGSDDPSDLAYARKIADNLSELDIEYTIRGGSAHTSPWHVFNIIREVENGDKALVYVCVAGRSDALSAFIDGQTLFPVIAAPPESKFGFVKYLSSIDTPSGIGTSLVIYPEAAAISVAKIFALNSPTLAAKINQLHENSLKKKIALDKKLQKIK